MKVGKERWSDEEIDLLERQFSMTQVIHSKGGRRGEGRDF